MNYKKTYVYLWLILAVALIIIIVIAFAEDSSVGNISLRQGTYKDVLMAPDPKESPETAAGADSTGGAASTSEGVAPGGDPRPIHTPDTTVKSVLIFGDSMTILIANRLAAYGKQNGYMVNSVTWDSSSSVVWSGCDTLDNFIRRYRPDFIMVTLGSNELFLRDFSKRKPYVEKILAKMGDIPFVWIGPPNWKEDQGYNDMMESTLPPGTFFRSEGIDLPRGKDKIHPTPKGGVIWTDTIMRWIAKSAHPIKAEVPDSSIGNVRHNSTYFRAK